MPAALIGDRAAAAGEVVATGQKISVADAERGGDEAAGLHAAGLADSDAVRIDQEHLPIGAEAAEDS
ncbi:hypothetical protein ABIF66_002157 [Bradyrhizobium japonicum]